jgi:ATP-dependent RNA helicase RhlE
METPSQAVQGFDLIDFNPLLKAAVQKAGFVTPTEIQAMAIPVALTGQDIMGIAQTGTGKTLAFALPVINSLLEKGGRALIIVPTRELALQVEENIRGILRFLNPSLRTACLIGGMPIYRQISSLKANPAIIIATPGRLNDHLERRTLRVDQIRFLVLDEADRMLDMGFAPQIKAICDSLTSERQTMLFSATMAPEVTRLANSYLTNPQRIEASRAGANSAQIKQELAYVGEDGKKSLLGKLLQEHSGTVLVFSRTKHGASRLASELNGMGHEAAEIHGDLNLGQRRRALDGFKTGRYRVLVATDVASRGIDVKDISLVVNYDLPDAAEDYVHRIGRTGRAGKEGMAISFATHRQTRDVQTIENLIRVPLKLSIHSEARPAARQYSGAPSGSRRPYSQPGRSSNFQRRWN